MPSVPDGGIRKSPLDQHWASGYASHGGILAERIVILTGGIGSGKSLAAGLFGQLGVSVVDADDLSHRLSGPGGAAIPEILAAFGPEVIAPDGGLDRKAMRARAFQHPAEREQLERILHPKIQALAAAALANAPGPYALYVVPLWTEQRAHTPSPITPHAVIVVDCPEHTQLERVMRRSPLSREQVQSIMAAQASRQQRRAIADHVLTNAGPIDDLAQQVRSLHARLIQP